MKKKKTAGRAGYLTWERSTCGKMELLNVKHFSKCYKEDMSKCPRCLKEADPARLSWKDDI